MFQGTEQGERGTGNDSQREKYGEAKRERERERVYFAAPRETQTHKQSPQIRTSTLLIS